MLRGTMKRVTLARGFSLEPPTQVRKLAREMLKAYVKYLETCLRRDEGDYDFGPQIQIAASPNASVAQKGPDQPKLSILFDRYLKEAKAGVVSATLKDLRAIGRLFVALQGDRQVSAYTKDDMSSFKRSLIVYPANATKFYPGLNPKIQIERARKDGKKCLSVASVNNKLAAMSAFGKWLENNYSGARSESFSTSLLVRSSREIMKPFSDKELEAIFGSGAFRGSSARNYRAKGEFKFTDWHFWIPAIAALSGARLNEISQLRISDIQDGPQGWLFNIAEGEGQSLKTKRSTRLVPVHQTLIKLGLLDYVEETREAGKEFLFQDIKPDRDGRRSTAAGLWFRKFLLSLGLKEGGSRGAMHRFRHAFTDKLRSAGILDHEIAGILGHDLDLAKVTQQYGQAAVIDMRRRVDLVNMVRIAALEDCPKLPPTA